MYEDLDRPALRERALQRALEPDGWRVEVVGSLRSTNEAVAARAAEPAGLVIVAEHQSAGRGRLDRSWVSPPRAGLTFSVLLRPALPAAELGWLPLLSGLAVAQAVREVCALTAELKWPNDILVDGRKICGVLAASPSAGTVVVGIGLNVTTRADELPDERAGSLHLAGASTTDRGTLLRAVLRSLRRALDDTVGAAARYRELCGTVGRQVRLELPDGRTVTGTAERVDDTGRLVVGEIAYTAGDVVHLR